MKTSVKKYFAGISAAALCAVSMCGAVSAGAASVTNTKVAAFSKDLKISSSVTLPVNPYLDDNSGRPHPWTNNPHIGANVYVGPAIEKTFQKSLTDSYVKKILK